MVGDGSGDRNHRCELALANQLVDELAVVQHLEVAAELGILVAQGVEAVRADGDYFFTLYWVNVSMFCWARS